MPRSIALLALLALSTSSAQTLSKQAAPLPYVTLSAPGYAVRAEVRPAVTYPESGPHVGPYFQFSPAQVRVVLDGVGQPRWKSQYPADMPFTYVTVTPVQNWLTLYKGAEMRAIVARQLDDLRQIGAGKVSVSALRSQQELPLLPLSNTFQAGAGAIKLLRTPQLQGVRYLGIRSQETLTDYPRGAVFYTFQGLSRDGKYVVSVRLPYAPASFPLEAGQPLMSASTTKVRRLMQARLDTENANLAALDGLVNSIRVR